MLKYETANPKETISPSPVRSTCGLDVAEDNLQFCMVASDPSGSSKNSSLVCSGLLEKERHEGSLTFWLRLEEMVRVETFAERAVSKQTNNKDEVSRASLAEGCVDACSRESGEREGAEKIRGRMRGQVGGKSGWERGGGGIHG